MFWKRALTAAVLIPLIVVLVLMGPYWLLAGVAGAVVVLALGEFFRLGEQAGLVGFAPWTVFCSLVIVYVQWARTVLGAQGMANGVTASPVGAWAGIEGILILYVFGLGVGAAWSGKETAHRLATVAISAAGMLLVALPLSYLVRLPGFAGGRRLLLLLLVMIWAGDTAAFGVGKAIGKMPMAPTLSPGKTWEGSAANLLASVGVGALGARWVPTRPMYIVELAVLANIAGQVGDLLESGYKRSAGAKDSGRLLPGHGGMLDRVDSLVLAAPVAWLYLWWLAWSGRLG